MKFVFMTLFLLLFSGCSVEHRKSDFSYSEIVRINPDLIIDFNTLLDEEIVSHELERLTKYLISNQFMVVHPIFGVQPNLEKVGLNINVIIQSGGGYVQPGKSVANFLESLNALHIRTTCYVSEAQSMAFYILVTGCNKVIAKPNVLLMQHQTYYPNQGTSPVTLKDDIVLATNEANKLGVDPEMWLNLTRTGKDKVFTLEEMKKYKLVHEFMNE